MAMRLDASSFTAAPVTVSEKGAGTKNRSGSRAMGRHGMAPPRHRKNASGGRRGPPARPSVSATACLPANECGGRAGAAINNNHLSPSRSTAAVLCTVDAPGSQGFVQSELVT